MGYVTPQQANRQAATLQRRPAGDFLTVALEEADFGE
jgi:hypothetical protein